MKKSLHLALLGAACTFAASAQAPEVAFMADFNSKATMRNATVGNDMEFVNADDKFIEFYDKGGVTENDGFVLVPVGSYIKADFSNLPEFTEPADPENPYISNYTIVWDVKLPTIGTYYCFLQTDPENGEDEDAKLCINGSGKFGSGFLNRYNSDWTAEPDTWYRLAFVVNKDNDNSYGLFVNGDPIEEDTSGNIGVDGGRYALKEGGTLFFADNDGEDAPLYCTKLMFYNKALTNDEVKTLGDPTTEISTTSVEGIASENNADVYADGNAILVKAGKDVKASVYNAAGQLVGNAAAAVGEVAKINVAVPGIYVVVCTDVDGVKSTKKVMVKL